MGYKSIREMTLPYVHSTASAIPRMGHILSLYMYRSLCMEYLLFFPTSEGFKFHLLCEAFPDYLVDCVLCICLSCQPPSLAVGRQGSTVSESFVGAQLTVGVNERTNE